MYTPSLHTPAPPHPKALRLVRLQEKPRCTPTLYTSADCRLSLQTHRQPSTTLRSPHPLLPFPCPPSCMSPHLQPPHPPCTLSPPPPPHLPSPSMPFSASPLFYCNCPRPHTTLLKPHPLCHRTSTPHPRAVHRGLVYLTSHPGTHQYSTKRCPTTNRRDSICRARGLCTSRHALQHLPKARLQCCDALALIAPLHCHVRRRSRPSRPVSRCPTNARTCATLQLQKGIPLRAPHTPLGSSTTCHRQSHTATNAHAVHIHVPSPIICHPVTRITLTPTVVLASELTGLSSHMLCNERVESKGHGS